MPTIQDILNEMYNIYKDHRSRAAPKGLYELVDPVVQSILSSTAYEICILKKEIHELKAQIRKPKPKNN